MVTEGIHYLSLSKARNKYEHLSVEYAQAKKQLAEAAAMGDLRENAEYDAAKTAVGKIAKELEALQPVMSMASIRANDAVLVIQEGCVIDLIIHKLTSVPVQPGSDEFEALKKESPTFHGLLAYGASIGLHELLVDDILKIDTPIGAVLLGKPAGDYSIEVPGGFSNLTVSKVFDIEDAAYLYCEIGGERHVEEE